MIVCTVLNGGQLMGVQDVILLFLSTDWNSKTHQRTTKKPTQATV